MNVEADICDRFIQDPSPCMSLGVGTSDATLEKPAYCETGRPISGEQWSRTVQDGFLLALVPAAIGGV
jgi:hypothetical protein